jgi:hypothetical protein
MLKAKESVSFRKLTATPRSAQPPKKSFFFCITDAGRFDPNQLVDVDAAPKFFLT